MTPDRRRTCRSNLVPAFPRPLREEQRRIHDIALRATRKPVRQLHETENDREPVRPDQYGRDVSQPASVWRLP